MDLSKMAVFKMAKHKLEWLAQRQKVLASNVANANTPDYRPQDLKELDFSNLMRSFAPRVPVKVTHPSHSSGTLPPPDTYRARQDRQNYESSPDGNHVVLEEQLLKVNRARSDYSLTTALYKKHMSMLKTALGRNR